MLPRGHDDLLFTKSIWHFIYHRLVRYRQLNNRWYGTHNINTMVDGVFHSDDAFPKTDFNYDRLCGFSDDCSNYENMTIVLVLSWKTPHYPLAGGLLEGLGGTFDLRSPPKCSVWWANFVAWVLHQSAVE